MGARRARGPRVFADSCRENMPVQHGAPARNPPRAGDARGGTFSSRPFESEGLRPHRAARARFSRGLCHRRARRSEQTRGCSNRSSPTFVERHGTSASRACSESTCNFGELAARNSALWSVHRRGRGDPQTARPIGCASPESASVTRSKSSRTVSRRRSRTRFIPSLNRFRTTSVEFRMPPSAFSDWQRCAIESRNPFRVKGRGSPRDSTASRRHSARGSPPVGGRSRSGARTGRS